MIVMFYVYVIVSFSKGLRFYVGMTGDVEKRLQQHNSRHTKTTKAYVPWQLFFCEKFPNQKEAREREKYLKSGSGKERIKERWAKTTELPSKQQAIACLP